MKGAAQLLFTAVALALMAADQPSDAKPLPPDDRADVTLLKKCFGSRLKLDAHGDIIEIDLDSVDLRTMPAVRTALARLRHVRTVQVQDDPRTLVGSFVKNWSELESVTLWSGATDADLQDLERLQKLKEVAICDGRWISDEGVKSVARHKDLERFILRTDGNPHSGITDACMKDIAGLPRLNYLDLKGMRITDEGVKHLKGKKLEYLGLRTTRITDRALDELKDMTSLKDLEVSDTKVTKAAIEKLKRRPGLEGLDVSGPLGDVHEVPDNPADVAAIEAAGITIAKSNVTDNVRHVYGDNHRVNPSAWISHLRGLHSVKELRLPDTTTDDDLQYVAGMKSLETLWLSGHFSDEGLKPISTLTNLKVLYCGNAGITSAGARHLTPIVNLEDLELTGCPIGDDGLRYLAGMKKTERIYRSWRRR